MKNLIIDAHLDGEILGCEGVIKKLSQKGNFVVILRVGADGRYEKSFINNLFVIYIDDLMENYFSRSFYNSGIKDKIYKEAKKVIESNGYFHIQKNYKIVLPQRR